MRQEFLPLHAHGPAISAPGFTAHERCLASVLTRRADWREVYVHRNQALSEGKRW